MNRLGRKQRAIISILQQQEWVRGRELADRIEVPHHVLFPYIERLRDRGFPITGDNVLGYRMEAN
jgi:predicted DNA-binding transcriptional regulator YafY